MNVRVRLKIKGVRRVLKSHGVQSEVARNAKRMADRAGDGFEYVVKPHRYTARAFVQTDRDNGGPRRQAEEHVLQRVVGGQ